MAACKNCGAENSENAVYCEDCGAQMSAGSDLAGAEAGELEPGQVMDGRFEIEKLIEAGPVNRYRARVGDRVVLLLQGRESEQLVHQRTVLQPLISPSVFTPDEFFQEAELPYAVGPWPDAERLEDLVAKKGPLNQERTEKLARVLLAALADIHEHGVLSRAVQPSRIWVAGSDRMILDLWDRAINLETRAEDTDSIAVSQGFSAPEMYGLGEPGPGTDLFSVGAVLHYCLSGQRPNFEARESFFTVAPPDIEGSEALVYVIMRSLSKRPEDRFADARAMLAALDAPVPARSEAAFQPSPAPAPRPAAVSPSVGRPPQPSGGRATLTEEMPLAPPNLRSSQTADKKTHVALKTDIGCVRSINQDACLELKFTFFEKSQASEAHLVAVIDGMGGEAEGDKAASIALRTIAQEIIQGSLALRDGRRTTPLLPVEPAERCRTLLQRSLLAANRNIYDYACLSEARRGMGCTITACILLNGTAHFAHVGDTRGYHLREELEQVTTDHSLVSRLVAMGTLTAEEARTSPQRSIIFRAMGTSPELEVDLYDRPLAPGDRLVLCSDGVWEYYEAGEFAEVVKAAPSPEALCSKLVDICLKRGADDNATVAVIDV